MKIPFSADNDLNTIFNTLTISTLGFAGYTNDRLIRGQIYLEIHVRILLVLLQIF